MSIQVQLSDTTVEDDETVLRMGSLEVLPGSHRPDTPNGKPNNIRKELRSPTGKSSNKVVAIDVPAGTVTIYSSRLWHRGGSNESDKTRTFCFFTVTEPDCLAPPGLIHTMEKSDIGRWKIVSTGLVGLKGAI